MSHKALLLVDDSPEDAQLMLHALRRVVPSEQVAVSVSAEQALEYLAARTATPQELPRVILLDVNLPRISGIEVLHRIRADAGTRLVPVVMLSASNERGDIEAAMRAGANSYIRKSLDYARLHEAMQLLAHYWLELNIEPSH